MKKLALTCIGKDKPGIVAKVSEVLFKAGCSIEGSRMSLLQGEFTIILIFTLFEEKNYHFLKRELKRVEYEMDIEIIIREIDPEEYIEVQKVPKKTFVINVYGADKPGIVFNVTNLLFINNINIIDLFTDVIESEGKKLYIMSITVDGSNISSIEFLKERIEKICKDMGLEVSVEEIEEVEM
ncbi:MAG: ACT domain-containing protein [Brevinematia bacterium]